VIEYKFSCYSRSVEETKSLVVVSGSVTRTEGRGLLALPKISACQKEIFLSEHLVSEYKLLD